MYYGHNYGGMDKIFAALMLRSLDITKQNFTCESFYKFFFLLKGPIFSLSVPTCEHLYVVYNSIALCDCSLQPSRTFKISTEIIHRSFWPELENPIRRDNTLYFLLTLPVKKIYLLSKVFSFIQLWATHLANNKKKTVISNYYYYYFLRL